MGKTTETGPTIEGEAIEIDDENVTVNPEEADRWSLLRDVAVFQGKLALDTLRDLALSPVSIGAAIAGVIRKPEDPGRYFYNLMQVGRHSDKWINLFSAAEKGGHQEPGKDTPSVDGLVDQLEGMILRQYEQGGVTKEAKEAIDRTLDKIHKAAKMSRKKPAPEQDVPPFQGL